MHPPCYAVGHPDQNRPQGSDARAEDVSHGLERRCQVYPEVGLACPGRSLRAMDRVDQGKDSTQNGPKLGGLHTAAHIIRRSRVH